MTAPRHAIRLLLGAGLVAASLQLVVCSVNPNPPDPHQAAVDPNPPSLHFVDPNPPDPHFVDPFPPDPHMEVAT
jgi:hypothetical protein